ncbi:hypothetical protein ASPBRDRAFT_48591 [Aspergillus brasiliensis CBS 101740]|uniref:Uncharacterized protein n=1 Tax=Aspergillus brasiliensis (strain CBS 101740 / IMI 381727 / IBT 21946) TaxID=767769 RepID=A0A1L9U4U3_ASPBC|nr:hypothetical protein ASPBRDRAFT_48591 [Aspergillus brasiliensis CBS 101740]
MVYAVQNNSLTVERGPCTGADIGSCSVLRTPPKLWGAVDPTRELLPFPTQKYPGPQYPPYKIAYIMACICLALILVVVLLLLGHKPMITLPSFDNYVGNDQNLKKERHEDWRPLT